MSQRRFGGGGRAGGDSDVAAGVAPDVAAGVAPDVAAGVAPDVAAGVAPDVAAGVAPDVAASATPSADPHAGATGDEDVPAGSTIDPHARVGATGDADVPAGSTNDPHARVGATGDADVPAGSAFLGGGTADPGFLGGATADPDATAAAASEFGGCDRPGDAGSPDRRWGLLLTSSLFFRRSPAGVRYVAAFVWLLFIVFPLINAVGKRGSAVGHGAIIGSAALFVAAYVTLVMRWRGERRSRPPVLLFAVLLAVSTGLTLSQASGWGFLFTYCAACAAVVAPTGLGLYAVALCSLLAGVTSSIAGADGGTTLGFVASSAGIGLLMLAMSDLRLRNEQLSVARAELARLAVAQERERFARDLHDLLGHSLSVIALKAELAGRMLHSQPEGAPADPRVLDQAATEVHELEQVARSALGEVRDAVSGYRQPTLEGELAGARMALSAAGIEADVQQARVPLDPAVEAVLAWTIREGATNVIRHSGARHCTLRITASLTDAGVEVIDDGAGAATDGDMGGAKDTLNGSSSSPGPADRAATALGNHAGTGGHGIAGLAERARLVNGTIEAGTLPDGGYRLAVTVPVSRA